MPQTRSELEGIFDPNGSPATLEYPDGTVFDHDRGHGLARRRAQTVKSVDRTQERDVSHSYSGNRRRDTLAAVLVATLLLVVVASCSKAGTAVGEQDCEPRVPVPPREASGDALDLVAAPTWVPDGFILLEWELWSAGSKYFFGDDSEERSFNVFIRTDDVGAISVTLDDFGDHLTVDSKARVLKCVSLVPSGYVEQLAASARYSTRVVERREALGVELFLTETSGGEDVARRIVARGYAGTQTGFPIDGPLPQDTTLVGDRGRLQVTSCDDLARHEGHVERVDLGGECVALMEP